MTNKAATPEPPPTGNGHVIVTELLKDILARDEMGRARYGTSLRVGNGRDALMDALQEALDLCFYLKQAIMERDDTGLCEIIFDMPKQHEECNNPQCNLCNPVKLHSTQDAMDEYIERLNGRNHE